MVFVCKFVTADLRGEEMRFVKGSRWAGSGGQLEGNNNGANRKPQWNDEGRI